MSFLAALLYFGCCASVQVKCFCTCKSGFFFCMHLYAGLNIIFILFYIFNMSLKYNENWLLKLKSLKSP